MEMEMGCSGDLPKSSSVQELGLLSPVGTLWNCCSAKSLILDLQIRRERQKRSAGRPATLRGAGRGARHGRRRTETRSRGGEGAPTRWRRSGGGRRPWR